MRNKILVATITSEGNRPVQDKFLARVLFLWGNYDFLLVENSATKDNYIALKEKTLHNNPHWHILRGVQADTLIEKIVKNRQITMDYALEHAYEWVLFIDSDILPPLDVLEKLIARNKPVISAFCEILDDSKTMLRPHFNGLIEEIKSGYTEEQLNKIELWKQSQRRLDIPELDWEGIVRCEHVGLGCLLVRADLLKGLSFRNDGNTQLNEDYMFTSDLKKKIGEIWVDLKVFCEHEMGHRGLSKNVYRPAKYSLKI